MILREFISPRSLSNEELDTLNKLLPIYEAKLNDIWQSRNENEKGQKFSEIILSELNRVKQESAEEIEKLFIQQQNMDEKCIF